MSTQPYIGLSRFFYGLISKNVITTPKAIGASNRISLTKEIVIKPPDAENVKEITKTLVESNLFSVEEMESNLWLFLRDPEDIAIKTLRIKQLIILHDINQKRTPSWFLHSLYAFNLRKIASLMRNYANDDAMVNSKSEKHFVERVSFLTGITKLSKYEVISKIESCPFLMTLSEEDMGTRCDILRNEANFTDADLQQRLYLLSSTPDVLRDRIRAMKEKGIDFKPHMFRLSRARVEKLVQALETSRHVFGGDNPITYLSTRLKIAPEDVAIMSTKFPHYDLLSVHPNKMKAMIDLLLSEGYTEEEIVKDGVRVFEYSIEFVAERIKRTKEVIKQRPPFYYFRLGSEFEATLEKRQESLSSSIKSI